MFNYYVRYLTRINPAYFMFIMQYKKLCYYNCKVFSFVQYFKKTNGNLNFVSIVNCKKDHDSLKEINENLIKDLKFIREIMFISIQWILNCQIFK